MHYTNLNVLSKTVVKRFRNENINYDFARRVNPYLNPYLINVGKAAFIFPFHEIEFS